MKPILDISYYQDPIQINYDKLLSQVAGVIIRVGYGTRKDTAFERHYSEIKARNIPVGAYHFVVEYKTVDEQLAMVRQAFLGKNFELGFWVDVELESGAEPLTRNTVIEYMTKAGSLVYGIYTGAWCWNPIMGKNNPYSNIPLWVADYVNSKPNLPYGWNNWKLWQYTSSGRLQGYSKNLDMNRFNGTEEQFQAWVGGDVEEPLPPEPPQDVEYYVDCTGNLNIRTGAGMNYPATGKYAYAGMRYKVYEISNNNWYRIDDGWISGNTQWTQLIPVPIEPEPEPPAPVPEPEPEPPAPEPEPEILFQARVSSWATPYVNLRSEPRVAPETDIGDVYPGTVVDVIEVLTDWYRTPKGYLMSKYLERLDSQPPVINAPVYFGAAYSQKDWRWKDLPLGTKSTIGVNGCLMVCASMVCNHFGHASNPYQLNQWLTENNGYESGNLFIWTALERLYPDMKFDGFVYNPTTQQIIEYISRGQLPIMWVDFKPSTPEAEMHWVLGIGIQNGLVVIADPIDGSMGTLVNKYPKPIIRFGSYKKAV